jgi:glycerophosphoryl diester phosphodiesterase
MAARTWWDGPDPTDFGGSVPRAVAAEGGATWGPDYRDLTEESLAEAHALGLKVVPWTVNQPEDMRRLIRCGVDGLITDRPDLAQRVLRQAAET